ncbi:MAG: hypothetical protein ACRBFS_27250 [Aureispira sp.]
MKKILGLTGIIIIIFFFIKNKRTHKILSNNDALRFYEEFGNKDFSMFKCLSLRQWNPKRKNKTKEYYIEYYPSCSKSNKPKRANVKYHGDDIIVTYQTIDSTKFDENILKDFYELNVSSLLYVDTSTLFILLYPNLLIKKSCDDEENEEYTYIGNCWYYKSGVPPQE